MHHHTDRITRTTAFVTPVVEHWLEQEIAQWVHSMKDRSDDPSQHERTLLPRSYISLFLRTSAALSIRLTRLKPGGPPRAGAHQKQRPMQPFRGRGDVKGPKEARGLGGTKSRGPCNLLGGGVGGGGWNVKGPIEARSLGALLWVNTALITVSPERYLSFHA